MAGEAMSVKEVAQELGCSGRWVCELIKRGSLPAKRIGVRTWIIDRAAFRRYLRRKAAQERGAPKV